MDTFKKYMYWATLALFAYMPFHIFLSQWLSTTTGGLDVWKVGKDVFTAGLVSVLVCTVLITRKHTRLFIGLVAIAVIYLVLHLALLVATNQPTDTGLLATTYNNRLIWYVLIGYSLALLLPRVARPRNFAKLLVILSTIVCVIALLQWVLPKDVMTHFGYSVERGVKPNFFIDDKPDLPRVFSTLRDPNSLGAFLILPVVFLVESLTRYWKTNRRMLLGGLLLLHGLILFLTFSRSAWGGVILAIFSLFVLKYGGLVRQHAQRLVLPGLAILVVLAGFIFVMRDQYVIQNVVFHSDENTRMTDSNNLHAIQIKKGLDGIANNPEGNGPGTAGLVSTKLPNGLITENYYVQIGYEVGLFGLAIFLGFLAIVVLNLWRNRKDVVTMCVLAAFVGLSAVNMLLHTWSNEAVAVSWFVLAGMVLVSSKETQTSPKQ